MASVSGGWPAAARRRTTRATAAPQSAGPARGLRPVWAMASYNGIDTVMALPPKPSVIGATIGTVRC